MNWTELRDALGDIPVNLLMAVVLAQVMTWHYLRYARVLSNKRKFARIFVFVAATTLLMITVVKQSLALSLGLVGALSIIRFRTPIKEPEELAYLFLAIAIGVGLGAGERAATVLVVAAILVYLAARSGMTAGGGVPQRTVLQVAAPLAEGGAGDGAAELSQLLPAVERHCSKVDLRRVDCGGGEFNASLFVELSGKEQLTGLLASVQSALTRATVSVIEWEGLE